MNLVSLTLVLLSTGTAVVAQPTYQIELDERDPTRIEVTLRGLSDQRRSLRTAHPHHAFASAPRCGSTPLPQSEPGQWLKPTGCTAVSWIASLSPLDQDVFDASDPRSGWSSQSRLWLLTNDLPWLRVDGQQAAPVEITSRLAGVETSNVATIPANASVPVAIVVGSPSRIYGADGFSIATYGQAPVGARAEELQVLLTSILKQWWDDILPRDSRRDHRVNYLWFDGQQRSEPGIFASSGSDAILMQFVPDIQASNPAAKLEAGILLTGAHEGFHTLMGHLEGARPTWVNESLASFFAYREARQHLSGDALQLADELINMPAPLSLLSVQRELALGNGEHYGTFYSKGARFWLAIEDVLTIDGKRSGRLAALMQQTAGMRGLDWTDPDAVGAYFDAHTNGRAGAVVRCYLREDGCREPQTN